MSTVRFGTLGVAWITPMALVEPAREVPGVEVAAIAARDPARARDFAARHGIPRVHRTYDDLLADPAIDAVYVPLPNSHHAEWALRALAAGKHVLVEKPFTANGAEARRVETAADGSGLVVMEAHHWRYHPQAPRTVELVRAGAVGQVRHVGVTILIPSTTGPDDIRFRYDLAGGITMDVGCYAVSCLRALGEVEVVSARAELLADRVDRHMAVELRYLDPWDGVAASVECGFTATDVVIDMTTIAGPEDYTFEVRIDVVVSGTAGRLTVDNPLAPKYGTGITVTDLDGRVVVCEPADPVSSYACQLRAFAAAVGGDPSANLTPPADAVATMDVVDAVYAAAGLPRRGA